MKNNAKDNTKKMVKTETASWNETSSQDIRFGLFKEASSTARNALVPKPLILLSNGRLRSKKSEVEGSEIR